MVSNQVINIHPLYPNHLGLEHTHPDLQANYVSNLVVTLLYKTASVIGAPFEF